MDHFKYRKGARIVAYIDVVLTGAVIIGLVALVFMGIFGTGYGVYAMIKRPSVDIAINITVIIVAMWICLFIAIVIGCINLYAAVMLLQATKKGAEITKALEMARFWRNVVLMALLVAAIYMLLLGQFISLAFQLVFRGMMLYFVGCFIDELDQSIKLGEVEAQIPICPTDEDSSVVKE